MKINDIDYTSLWYDAATDKVLYIDQTRLPHELVILEMKTFEDGIRAITNMEVRGAPLIGVAAAFAMYVGMRELTSGDDGPPPGIDGPLPGTDGPHPSSDGPPPNPLLVKEGETLLRDLGRRLIATRPTAVNLAWAVSAMLNAAGDIPAGEGGAAAGLFVSRVTRHASRFFPAQRDDLTPGPSPALPAVAGEGGATAEPPGSLVTRHSSLLNKALKIRQYELNNSYRIGLTGLEIIRAAYDKNGNKPVNILTHCNAGWLAAVDYGTALAPVYLAHDSGIPVHVWVDETRPRNQGAKLTAWELSRHGVPCTLITDNAGGLLMQQGKVDMVIVGADRITANGDVINKVGTYLKALAARDNGVPFYVAAPSSTFDPATPTGADVEIEERSADEVLLIEGIPIAPEGTKVWNPGFDVTPGEMVTGYITPPPAGLG